MRRLFTKMLVIAGVFCIGMIYCGSTHAQGSCAEVLKRAVVMIAKLEEEDAQIQTITIDSIASDQTCSNTMQLERGEKYMIVGIGDDVRIQDLDLYVYDENDNEVGRDNDNTNVAVVTVSPRWTGRFKFKVDGYEMSHKKAFYALIIAKMQ